jgi:trk system potassium uptake protein TrkA
MKIIVIGCGRVGSNLAVRLVAEGHDVHVVDRDPAARDILPVNFAGHWLVGNGFNRSTLDAAGIATAEGFVAVTSGDNTNIVAARTAKEEYRVPLVVARIYDPRRAGIYRELGISTVASVVWTVGQIHQMLLHRHLDPQFSFGNGETILVRSTLPAHLTGRPLRDLEVDAEIRVVEVTRTGRSFVPEPSSVAESGDLVSFTVAATALHRLKDFLDRELGT